MFNIGDLVRIIPDANTHKISGLLFNPNMNEFLGHEFVVKSIDGAKRYKLEDAKSDRMAINGDGYWVFHESWLEPVDTLEFEMTDDEFINIFE